MNQPPDEISFQALLDTLRNTDEPVSARYIYRLSDLEPAEVAQLEEIWAELPPLRRQALMEDLEIMGERDTLLSFEAVALLAIRDPEAAVRLPAVRTLWEFESSSLIQPLLQLMNHDENLDVRAAAAAGLGKFVYLGEVDQITPERLHQVEEALLKVARQNEPELLQRRALESLGFSSREEVPALILSAYSSSNTAWVATALLAMGRSAHERWQPQVTRKLADANPAVRTEAARAAGELEIKDARKTLIELLEDSEDTVRLAAAWSLSQIGGAGVREALERLYEQTEDEEEAEFIEDALDNLAFTEDIQLYDLFDISEDGSDPYDVDLDEELED